MISSEVQRTLVKSPPELWAELSDPTALARHLGELGEIRITRIEPEKLVVWEAEGTTGTVAIKASGWGTKVTLTVSGEAPEPEASEPQNVTAVEETTLSADEATEHEPAPTVAGLEDWASQEAEHAGLPAITAAERFAHDEPAPLLGTRLESHSHSEPEHEPIAYEQPAPPLAAEAEPEIEPATTEPEPPAAEPRRGFLARLFGRRRAKTEPAEVLDDPPIAPQDALAQAPGEPGAAIDAPPVTPAPEPLTSATTSLPRPETRAEPALLAPGASPPAEKAEPEASAGEETLPVEPAQTKPVADIGAELRAAEETAAEDVRAILTAVLDRLGAAHHRPFSRS